MNRPDEVTRFIEAWGSMGVLWGINRSMARVHALLLLSEEPVDAEEISSSLGISRGNVSMCLRELRSWGVVHRGNRPGDRRDFFTAEPDVWTMLHRIALGRKAREFDPAISSLRHLLAEVETERSAGVHQRLTQLEEILGTLERVMRVFLASEKESKALMELVRNLAPE
jgi:DNA-binding transcriptional regulator GbsR (MarR family)